MEDENIVSEIKYYDKEEYIKVNKSNLSTILNGVNIIGINLYGYDLFKSKNGMIKMTYTDFNNPIVVSKDAFNGFRLNINPEYYLGHKSECQNVINYVIKNCKEKSFNLFHKGLLNDETIKSLCENRDIEKISVEKYSANPYILTVDDYKIFKKYNKKIDTNEICDELKDVFDDTIVFNSNKRLISFYNYDDLININELQINQKLNEEELKYIKFINKNAKIVIDIDDYETVFEIINLIEKNNGNNSYSIEVNDKEKFNEYIFKNNIVEKNIKVNTATFDDVNLDEYLNFERVLYQMIEPARNLSNFEKYIYAYNITKQFKIYRENKEDLSQSRNLYNILANEYMVCVGFSSLLGDLLNKLGVPNMKLGISVDQSYDNVKSDVDYVNTKTITNRVGHARRYVHLVDDKYGLNGFYVSDPTWDNDLQNDYYNHSVMTDKESNMSSRYQWSNNYDIYDVSNINDYYDRVKDKFNKMNYKDFCIYFKSRIEEIKQIDGEYYNKLKSKYDFISEAGSKWPDSITELVNDFGVYLLNKVNKVIDGKTLFECIRNIYLHSYGYDENSVDDVLNNVIEHNKERQQIVFPVRKKINSDGTSEIVMNENNKFDFEFSGKVL